MTSLSPLKRCAVLAISSGISCCPLPGYRTTREREGGREGRKGGREERKKGRKEGKNKLCS
jgi:hypothetical protein